MTNLRLRALQQTYVPLVTATLGAVAYAHCVDRSTDSISDPLALVQAVIDVEVYVR